MTDSELIDQVAVLQPDMIALVRAVVRDEIRKWADARRDGLMREARFIEKNILSPTARPMQETAKVTVGG